MGVKDWLDIVASFTTVCGFIFAVFKWLQLQERRQGKPPAPPPVQHPHPPQQMTQQQTSWSTGHNTPPTSPPPISPQPEYDAIPPKNLGPIGSTTGYDATPIRVALRSGLLVGGVVSPVGGISLLVFYNVYSKSTPEVSSASAVGILAILVWLLLILLHPVIASFITVWRTRRLRSGIGAAIIAACIFAFTTVVVIAIVDDVQHTSGYGLAFDIIFHVLLVVLLMTMAVGVWLLPCTALAALGGLAANVFNPANSK